MNIHMQLCGLIIMLFLLYFFLRHRLLNLITEKIFLISLSVSIVSSIFDMASVIALSKMDFLPLIAVAFLCKGYLIVQMQVAYFALIYAVIESYSQKDVVLFYIITFVDAACCLGAIFLPISYHSEGNVYTDGLAVNVAFAFSLACILFTLAIVFVLKRRTINVVRSRAVAIWMMLWLIACTIQLLNRELLVIGFAMAVGMTVLFFELENPEANVDRATGLLNAHAMVAFLEQQLKRKEFFTVFTISLKDKNNENKVEPIDEFLLRQMASYLLSFKRVWVFKDVGDAFTIVTLDHKLSDEIEQKCMQRFSHPFRGQEDNRVFDPLYISVPDGRIAENAAELLSAIRRVISEELHISDRFVVVDEKKLDGPRQMVAVENMIIDAISEDRVEAHFQPIYSTAEKKIVSAEALVRIKDVDGSYIAPGKFIPVAEKTGLISVIGEIVFDRTCRLMKWNELWKFGIHYIEVNLSTVQAQQSDLVEIYSNLISRYELSPKYINLEITESSSITKMDKVVANMNRFIEKGFTFSLDDFGSGESNLNYIVDMPVTLLKFDMDMVRAYFENDKAKHVMIAAMGMAHDMGLKVVAEGVETKEMLDEMERIGVDYIQGYYFSKALPGNEYIEYVQKFNNQSI